MLVCCTTITLVLGPITLIGCALLVDLYSTLSGGLTSRVISLGRFTLTDYSYNVHVRFGPDAAGILNRYACALEDALKEASDGLLLPLARMKRELRRLEEEFAPPRNNIVAFTRVS